MATLRAVYFTSFKPNNNFKERFVGRHLRQAPDHHAGYTLPACHYAAGGRIELINTLTNTPTNERTNKHDESQLAEVGPY